MRPVALSGILLLLAASSHVHSMAAPQLVSPIALHLSSSFSSSSSSSSSSSPPLPPPLAPPPPPPARSSSSLSPSAPSLDPELLPLLLSTLSQPFQHPGVVVSAARIAYVRQQIAQQADPIFSAFKKALASPSSNKSYAPLGPPPSGIIDCGSYDHPDHGCSDEDNDGDAAALQALLFVLTDEQVYARNAIAIMNAYAHGFRHYNNSNAPLQAAWSACKWTRAAELMLHSGAGWAPAQAAAFVAMLYRTHLPLIYPGSGANGNWELSMVEGMLGLAVLSDNATLFAHATAMWLQRLPAYVYITSDGSLPVPPPRGSPTWYGQRVFNASVTGICQETCRDLSHTQMGLASAINAAETAYVQGVDLYAQGLERLRATLEFHSKLLLPGAVVPEMVCSGNVTMGQLPTFEIAYNDLHNRRNITLPLTLQHLVTTVRTNPNPINHFMVIYETLTHGGSKGLWQW